MKKNLKKLYTFLCICMLVMLFPLGVAAAPDEETPEITVRYPLADVRFDYHKVADFSETGVFVIEDEFAAFMEEVTDFKLLEENPEAMTADSWRKLAATLDSLVHSKKLEPDFSYETDEEGNITCEVEKGLYLLLAEGKEHENKFYTPPANLVTVPNRDVDGNWQTQVVIDYSNKVEVDSLIEEYTVQKIWAKDEDNVKNRPEEITVELYMDDERVPYAAVKLNVQNNWKYTWKELPIGHKWTVAEKEVPANYKVSYVTEGNILSITNEYAGPETPPPPTIPQTGQLWWPVPVLAVLGIVFFTLGWVRRRNGEC